MRGKEIQLNRAEQQFTGFKSARNGDNLEDLVESMGLTEKEWGILKKDYELAYLSPDDFKDINSYFKTL